MSPYKPQPPMEYGFTDYQGCVWCNAWVDSYNRLTEIINLSGDGVSGSLAERERNHYLDRRHEFFVMLTELASQEKEAV